MKKIKKATREIIENMEETILSTIKFYRDMQTDETYAEKYSEENLRKEVETMAKAYNMLLVNQYNILSPISKHICVYETMIAVRVHWKEKEMA
jgi:hypothetical protein